MTSVSTNKTYKPSELYNNGTVLIHDAIREGEIVEVTTKINSWGKKSKPGPSIKIPFKRFSMVHSYAPLSNRSFISSIFLDDFIKDGYSSYIKEKGLQNSVTLVTLNMMTTSCKMNINLNKINIKFKDIDFIRPCGHTFFAAQRIKLEESLSLPSALVEIIHHYVGEQYRPTLPDGLSQKWRQGHRIRGEQKKASV